MVGIVHDPNSHGAATSYATKNKMAYPLAFDPGDRTSLNYGVTGQPETFLIDKAGIVDEWVWADRSEHHGNRDRTAREHMSAKKIAAIAAQR